MTLDGKNCGQMTKTIPTQREKSNTILDKWISSNQSTIFLSFWKISGRGIKQNVFHRQHLILIAFRDPIPFHPTFPQIAFEHLSVAFCGSWSPNSTDLYFWYLCIDRPIQLICISDIYTYVNRQIQKTWQGNLLYIKCSCTLLSTSDTWEGASWAFIPRHFQ